MRNVIAVAAVAVLLTGSATVAVAEPFSINSVRSAQIKNGAVKFRDLGRKVRAAIRADRAGEVGPAGPAGPIGPAGADGGCTSSETLDIPSVGLVEVCVP